MAITKVDKIIRFSRAYCAEKLPWFAPALFQCRIHLSEQVAVAAIDYHFNIYFNPKAVLLIEEKYPTKEALAQLGFLWIHEISHVLREHGERAKEQKANAYLWNIAADLEINDSNWEGLQAPLDFKGVFPHQFNLTNGEIAEFYYQKVVEKYPIKELENLAASLPSIMDDGSGAHGAKRPWEINTPAEKKQKKDEVGLEVIRRAVAREMKEQIQRGNMPGNWSRWVEEKLNPKVDWRQQLQHRMSVAINTGVGNRIDYSYSRPNRRHAINGRLILPRLGGDLTARITCIVDTSGSMSAQQLAQCVGEILGILTTFQHPVTVIPCDAQAYEPIKVASTRDFVKLQQLKGGGGTDMIVGIKAALQLKPAPDSILVLTDGYTPYPAAKYKTPVVFGIFAFPQQVPPRPPNPPWNDSDVVIINLKEILN